MNSLASTSLRSLLLLAALASLRAEEPVPFDQLTSSASVTSDLSLAAASTADRFDHASDPLFPRQGAGKLSLLTGVPYLGIAEYAHGVTDRFAVGVFAGIITPEIQGYGVRLRYVLAQPTRDFRVHVKAPLIYYPASPGLKPWFLVWPTVSAEWRRESGTRLWTGVGLVATNGGLSLTGGGYGASAVATTAAATTRSYGSGSGYGSSGGARSYGAGGTTSAAAASSPASHAASSEGGVWNTFQLGFSRPITRRVTFQFEAAAVLKGMKLSPSSRWVAGPPVIVTTGLSYGF